MAKITKYLMMTAAAAVVSCVFSTGVLAAPMHNERHELIQPDGSKVQVMISGDEYYQRVESLDGYTLCRDKNGWICYAKLNGDKTDYVSTGTVYKDNTSNDMKISINTNNTVGAKNKLQRHLKIKKEAIKKKADSVRQKLHAMDYSPEVMKRNNFSTNSLLESKIKTSNISNVNGLTILVDFSDQKSAIPESNIESFFNGVGYTGYGNNGSIRDYYYDVSGGKLTYTNKVIGFYRAKHRKSYYDDLNETTGSYAKSDELANEVFNWLKDSGIDVSNITTDSNGYAKAVNILYAGTADAGWAKGLWPHQAWYGGRDSINGVKIQKYEMSDIGDDLSIFTICHESGHMIYGYPDLYDYDNDSEGDGEYSLMSECRDYKNPVPPDPYCRNVISGWNTPINMNSYAKGTKFNAVADANGNQYSYKWSSNNPKEYYLIENIEKNGRYASIPDAGLAIWHVDENGDNSKNAMTANNHFLVSLEQADGRFDLENNANRGDDEDLFRAGYVDSFDDTTTPNSKWWNGSSSGLNISQISSLGNEMTFVQSGSNVVNPTNPTNPTNLANIAGQGTPSTSYVSDWENIGALNDGKDPTSSNDRSGAVYGNWPKTGSQWVKYDFDKQFTISSCDVYWFKDGQGIDVPASYKILYWDGSAWQYVKNPKGLGTTINKYNTTTFTPVTTNAIAIQMESNGDYSTGILEWKVYGK